MTDLFTNVCPTCKRPLDWQDEDAEFAEWWAAWPHKVAKGGARTAFKAARKKAPLEKLIEGVERYKQTKPKDRPWCHPDTWLRQERWLDMDESQVQDDTKLVDLQRRHVEAFIRKGIWLDTWGERPDHPNADPRVRRIYTELQSRP